MPDTTAPTGVAWLRGTVVEDRWGLRWRADTIATGPRIGQDGWQCRSVGLKVWRTDEQMLERGPLRFVRLDQVFAGDAAKAARIAGEAADGRVIVDPETAEDAPDV